MSSLQIFPQPASTARRCGLVTFSYTGSNLGASRAAVSTPAWYLRVHEADAGKRLGDELLGVLTASKEKCEHDEVDEQAQVQGPLTVQGHNPGCCTASYSVHALAGACEVAAEASFSTATCEAGSSLQLVLSVCVFFLCGRKVYRCTARYLLLPILRLS